MRVAMPRSQGIPVRTISNLARNASKRFLSSLRRGALDGRSRFLVMMAETSCLNDSFCVVVRKGFLLYVAIFTRLKDHAKII